jgi:hypothetical protein
MRKSICTALAILTLFSGATFAGTDFSKYSLSRGDAEGFAAYGGLVLCALSLICLADEDRMPEFGKAVVHLSALSAGGFVLYKFGLSKVKLK